VPGLRGLGAIAPTLKERIDAFGSIRHQASASDVRWRAPNLPSEEGGNILEL
jgi:hypothetical protein